MRAKCSGELLEGIYGICPQAVEPSHRHGSQTRWKHLAYQGFVFGVDNHSLIEVAFMFYRVRSTIVDGECGMMEPPRKSCPFNLARERLLGNLVQHFAYSFISQAFARRALVPTFVMVFFIVGEGLAGWSSWPSPITSILFTLRGNVRVGGGLFSPCTTQLPL